MSADETTVGNYHIQVWKGGENPDKRDKSVTQIKCPMIHL